jgi:hypothetical protein
MACTASFINWNADPLTQIPCSRWRDGHGKLHEKGCGCEKCAGALASACEDLRRNIRTLAALLGVPVPAVLAEADVKPAALYACWFEHRNEFIKEVTAGRIQYPAQTQQVKQAVAVRRPLTSYSLLCPDCKRLAPCVLTLSVGSVREACAVCEHDYQVRSVETLQDLLTLGPDADRLAGEASRQRLIRPHAVSGVEYAEPYQQPKRITEFHEGRFRARALVAASQAAYRARSGI